jgi:hypothetical protein
VIDVKGIALTDVKVISGTLPDNTSVEPDGTILIGLGQGRKADTYTFVVTGLGTDLNDYEVTVEIELVDFVPSRPFTQTLAGIRLPVQVNQKVGQIEGPPQGFLHVEIVGGLFPDGLAVTADGSLVVVDPQLVRAGKYVFDVLCLGDDGFTYEGRIEVEIT